MDYILREEEYGGYSHAPPLLCGLISSRLLLPYSQSSHCIGGRASGRRCESHTVAAVLGGASSTKKLVQSFSQQKLAKKNILID